MALIDYLQHNAKFALVLIGVIILIRCVLFHGISDPWSKDFRPLILSSDDGPIFDNSLVTNVTAQFGGTAHLPCKVHNIKYADNPVSTNKISC